MMELSKSGLNIRYLRRRRRFCWVACSVVSVGRENHSDASGYRGNIIFIKEFSGKMQFAKMPKKIIMGTSLHGYCSNGNRNRFLRSVSRRCRKIDFYAQ